MKASHSMRRPDEQNFWPSKALRLDMSVLVSFLLSGNVTQGLLHWMLVTLSKTSQIHGCHIAGFTETLEISNYL